MKDIAWARDYVLKTMGLSLEEMGFTEEYPTHDCVTFRNHKALELYEVHPQHALFKEKLPHYERYTECGVRIEESWADDPLDWVMTYARVNSPSSFHSEITIWLS